MLLRCTFYKSGKTSVDFAKSAIWQIWFSRYIAGICCRTGTNFLEQNVVEFVSALSVTLNCRESNVAYSTRKSNAASCSQIRSLHSVAKTYTEHAAAFIPQAADCKIFLCASNCYILWRSKIMHTMYNGHPSRYA